VLGFGGVFAVFTYIAPMLTQLAGFDKGAVSADPAGVRRRPGRRQHPGRQAGRPRLVPTVLGSWSRSRRCSG
jgi:hypothetical protein